MSTTAETQPKKKRNKTLVTAKIQGIIVALLMAPILGIVPLFGMGSGEPSQVAISLVVALVTVLSAAAAILAFSMAKTPEKAKKSSRFTVLPILFAVVIFVSGLIMFGEASGNPSCNQLGCLLALSIGPMIMGYGAAVGLLSFGQFTALNRYSNSAKPGTKSSPTVSGVEETSPGPESPEADQA